MPGMPPKLTAAPGLDDYGSPTGFLDGNLYAVFLPLPFAVLGIMHSNALTAGDEDAGRMELLPALRVSRVSVYLSRFLSVALVLAVVATVVGATVGFAAPAFDMNLRTTGVVAVTLGMCLLVLFHASLAVALAGFGLRGPVVLATSFAVLALG